MLRAFLLLYIYSGFDSLHPCGEWFTVPEDQTSSGLCGDLAHVTHRHVYVGKAPIHIMFLTGGRGEQRGALSSAVQPEAAILPFGAWVYLSKSANPRIAWKLP